MFIELVLPPDSTPVIQPYTRTSNVTVGPPIAGVVLSGRDTRYRFDITDLALGDYTVDMVDPLGSFLLRIDEVQGRVSDQWWKLDVEDGSQTGEGANAITFEVTDSNDNPLAGITVRATRGGETYFQTTSISGSVMMSLDNGVWVISAEGIGYSVTPINLTVAGNATIELTGILSAGFLLPAPGLRVGYWKVLGLDGNPLQNAVITLKPIEANQNSVGYAQVNGERSITSGIDGMIYASNLIPGMDYEAKLNSGEWFSFKVPNGQSNKPLPLGTLRGSANA